MKNDKICICCDGKGWQRDYRRLKVECPACGGTGHKQNHKKLDVDDVLGWWKQQPRC